MGAPGRANAEFAKASLTVLREEASWVIGEFLLGKVKPSRFRSKLYRLPMFRTNFMWWVLGGILLILFIIRLLDL
jgi:hypothetical protein